MSLRCLCGLVAPLPCDECDRYVCGLCARRQGKRWLCEECYMPSLFWSGVRVVS